MCGIIGYTGKRNSVPVLLEGLKRLEYRGYDSAGIAFHNRSGIDVYKTEGKIKDLEKILPNPLPEGGPGLGHTRWATHGEPSTRNAHPHLAGGVAVVHNGIIENYRELKFGLLSEGHKFDSETDTEVIPRMILRFMSEGYSLKDALKQTVLKLRGTFAIGAMSRWKPDVLLAVRKGSPLVIGHGDGEYFFASDLPAILPYTRRVTYLEDGQMCEFRAGRHEIERIEHGAPDGGRIVEVDWSPSMAEKEGYDFFMLKEIYEQPRVVRDTLGEWLEEPRRLLDDLGLTSKKIMGLRRIQIAACGTSFYAGLVGKYVMEAVTRVPVDVEIASEYRYRIPILENGHALFISITQSGETADTLAAQREAKQRGVGVITVCNSVGSAAAREADAVLYTRAGPEIGVASTKSFTAQLAALYLLAIGLGIKRGRLFASEAATLKSWLAKMPSLMEKALGSEQYIKGLARVLSNASGYLFMGRGVNYPIALEGALKLKEISYVHAEGYPAGEMKHGPIALIERGKPVVTIAPTDELFGKTLSNIEEARARGGRVIAVTDDGAQLSDRAKDIIEVPATHPLLSVFVNIIPLQLLAYHVAVLRGNNVDQPRNLAKSVTVE